MLRIPNIECFRIFIFLSIVLWGAIVLGAGTEALKAAEEPAKEGNFILPTSQQLGPFFSFGQNIIDKNQWIGYMFGESVSGVETRTDLLSPSILYGITDDLSILVDVSFSKNQTLIRRLHSDSISDGISAQMEYAFYSQDTKLYSEQSTVVANITVPLVATGAFARHPKKLTIPRIRHPIPAANSHNFGIGSNLVNFFVGGTFSRMYTDWYAFISDGVVITTSQHGNQAGDQYLYQAGLGRYLFDIRSKWVLSFLIEADGTYFEEELSNGNAVPHTQGNIIFLTPSLLAASERIFLQFGVGFPVLQKIPTISKVNYLAGFTVGVTL